MARCRHQQREGTGSISHCTAGTAHMCTSAIVQPLAYQRQQRAAAHSGRSSRTRLAQDWRAWAWVARSWPRRAPTRQAHRAGCLLPVKVCFLPFVWLRRFRNQKTKKPHLHTTVWFCRFLGFGSFETKKLKNHKTNNSNTFLVLQPSQNQKKQKNLKQRFR